MPQGLWPWFYLLGAPTHKGSDAGTLDRRIRKACSTAHSPCMSTVAACSQDRPRVLPRRCRGAPCTRRAVCAGQSWGPHGGQSSLSSKYPLGSWEEPPWRRGLVQFSDSSVRRDEGPPLSRPLAHSGFCHEALVLGRAGPRVSQCAPRGGGGVVSTGQGRGRAGVPCGVLLAPGRAEGEGEPVSPVGRC